MPDDNLLLVQYVTERSEAAFAELVRRHVDLVYSAALRRVAGDHHRATDVTQDVFLSLARHASRLTRHPALEAWLHVSTRNAAANLHRAEQRRAHHAQQAQAMHDSQKSEAGPGDWERVRPVLDQTLDQLSERERRAVILRFFAGRSYAEIGAALSLREDAARKQVARTLEKIHQLLARQGVTSTESALATAISENAVAAAPAGVAALVTSHALVGGAAGGALTLLHFASWTPLKVGLAAALIAGGVALVMHPQGGRADRVKASLIAARAPATQPPVPAASIASAPSSSAAVETVEYELAQALAYDQDKTSKRDAQRAGEWYRRAAAQGSAAAEFRLGYFYEIGDGVPQSYTEARVHYQRAIALGMLSANLRLGILDLEGWGGARDVDSAVRHITAAANAGDQPAQRVLSGMYFAGIGVKADLHQALAWETQAAQADDPAVEADVGIMMGLLNQQNASIAQEWYQLSAEQDYDRGLLGMASTFIQPGSTPEQVEQGRKWLELAADHGNGAAAFYLAGIDLLNPTYATRPDAAAQAKALLEKARDKGENTAAEVLELSASRPLAEAFRYVVSVPPEQRYVTQAADKAARTKPDAHGFLPPVIVKSVQPIYPSALQLTRTEGEVVVDFHVDTTGRPRRAKAVRSSHPGFAASAVRAVEEWRFTPAQMNGHAVEAHLAVPVVFKISAMSNDSRPIRCEIKSITYRKFVGGGIDLRTEAERRAAQGAGQPERRDNAEMIVTLQLQSGAAIVVRTARTMVTTAEDETGADLKIMGPPNLYSTAVGAELPGSSRPFEIELRAQSPGAKTLRTLEGTVELVVPDFDPSATVVVDQVLAKAGLPLAAPALAQEDITLVVYDSQACDRFREAKFGAGGPQDYDAGPMFSSRAGEAAYAGLQGVSPALAKALASVRPSRPMTMSNTALAVGISDPHGHLIGVEFRTREGQPLRYNHNGNYHSSGMLGRPERRFDIYDLGLSIPADVQLVCWVATNRALVKVPFHFADVALPFSGQP